MDLLCFFCLVFAMPLYASVYMCLVFTCWGRADLLALVCGVLPRFCLLLSQQETFRRKLTEYGFSL